MVLKAKQFRFHLQEDLHQTWRTCCLEPRLTIRLSLPEEVLSSKQEVEGVCVEPWGLHTSGVNTRQCTEAGRIQQSPLHWTSINGKEAEFHKEEHTAYCSWTAWAEAIIPRANISSFGHIFFNRYSLNMCSAESSVSTGHCCAWQYS